MLISGAGCVFMGFILFISGFQVRTNSICALKGSSVDLPCSAQHPTSTMKWYTGHWIGYKYTLNDISADGNHVTYNMSAESNFTLTIKDLTERDGNNYCCGETDKPEKCWGNRIQLCVADLQVKVIPTTEGQTVTLICSTSCPLTENPAVYIWYKNREFLYQDWSPWYQQLVSSEEAVTYSCAIKGYEDLRAPQVSVDSVSSTCFKVTYAKGRMCSSQQTSEDEPCSITYPTEVHVQMSPAATSDHVRVTCNSSCPPTAFIWYKSSNLVITKEVIVPTTAAESFSCAVKGHEDLHSAEICPDNRYCWSVNYVSRRICALEGSSLNISSEYSENQQPKYKLWYKIKRSGKEEVEERMKAAGRVTYHDNMKNHHILRINNLKKDDSAEYSFTIQRDDERWKPVVTLVVTGLKVQFSPSAVVIEDQRVTLTCSTSCPLTDNTNYIWFFNSRPLTLTDNQNKHLVLDPVSSQHAGNYSCAVRTHNNSSSHEETLTVQSMRGKWTPAAAAGVCAALLVIIPLSVFCWIRRKRTSSQSPRAETSHNMEQVNPGPVYDEISAQPTEQDDLHYSRVHFRQNQSDLLYSTVQTHPPQEQDLTPYAVVNFRPNTTPEHDGQAVDP
ncbi:B-cell receptor CD22-like isoform X1 [Sebastes fasciatus]|uniref:B-cell receptor CD22-like isoform X1 n=1 Tax=Sebastes fasciatus TaxID=394691 RepID=UPI003D9E2419